MNTVPITGEEVLDALRAAVGVVLELDPATVTRQSRFVEDLRADSLAIVEIVEIVEAALAARSDRPFQVDDEALDDLVTVGDAVDHAMARL